MRMRRDRLVEASRSAIASWLHTHHSTLTNMPISETPARCGFVSAVPSAATRKLLGIRNSSVTLIRSGCGDSLMAFFLCQERLTLATVGPIANLAQRRGLVPRSHDF